MRLSKRSTALQHIRFFRLSIKSNLWSSFAIEIATFSAQVKTIEHFLFVCLFLTVGGGGGGGL